MFPAGQTEWDLDVSALPVHPLSAAYMDSMGASPSHGLHPDFGTVYNDELMGIQYVYVDNAFPTRRGAFLYAAESDAGPYPLPVDAPIEGSHEPHILTVDHCITG